MTTSAVNVYARAAFEYAREHDALASWQAFLLHSAAVFSHAGVVKVLVGRQVSERSLVEDLQEVINAKEEQKIHFLWLLADKKRLLLLPLIAEAFKVHCAKANQQVTAKVLSAVSLTKVQQQKLQKELSAKWGKQVELDCQEDASVLGGVIIKIGDKVIDRSMLGTLMRLKQSMLG